MGTDDRLNSTDLVHGINTGLRGLVPVPPVIPTDVEIGKAIEDAIKANAGKSYTPAYTNSTPSSGSGSRYGGGSGSYSHGRSPWYPITPYYTAVYGPPTNYGSGGFGNSIPFLNIPSVIIRRSTIRRERVSSERGRLNQWQ
jgi:hypothetical protein